MPLLSDFEAGELSERTRIRNLLVDRIAALDAQFAAEPWGDCEGCWIERQVLAAWRDKLA